MTAQEKEITEVRITDPVVKRIVQDEQVRLGDATATKTAGRIIQQWVAMRDVLKATNPAAPATASPPAPSITASA